MTHSDNGFFDRFGGKYVAEVLRSQLDELEAAFNKAMKDPAFLGNLPQSREIILAAKLHFYMQKLPQNFWAEQKST